MSIALPPALERLLAHEDEPLGPRTTLGVGGPAPWVLEPRSRAELLACVAELTAASIPFRLLGQGSNVLVSDAGVDEVVIHTVGLRHILRHGEREHALRCEAGAGLARLVTVAAETGLSGAEALVGIPGTVGGAFVGNAGGRHGCLGDVAVEVTLAAPDGAAEVVACGPADFGYRTSRFRGRVVVDVVLQLAPAPAGVIRERMAAILREKRRGQPLAARSAGCMFKNPGGDASSGELIERAGCKGLSVGAARVSERHANFVLNTGGAAAADVMRLVRAVRRRVRDEHGVSLDLEVEPWGGFDDGPAEA